MFIDVLISSPAIDNIPSPWTWFSPIDQLRSSTTGAGLIVNPELASGGEKIDAYTCNK